MGTDIHATFQRLEGEPGDQRWVEFKSEWEQDRDYLLFAILAGVRNGFGFAGVPIFSPVNPISELRGLPEDMRTVLGDHNVVHTDEGLDTIPFIEKRLRDNEWEIDDRRYSWVTSAEILKWRDRPENETVTLIAVIRRKEHDGLPFGGVPSNADICGWISGRGVLVLPDYVVRANKHLEVEGIPDRMRNTTTTMELILQLHNPLPDQCLDVVNRSKELITHYTSIDPYMWSMIYSSRYYLEFEETQLGERHVKAEDYTHVRVLYKVKIKEQVGYFFDMVERLEKEHGEFRIVFSFDN